MSNLLERITIVPGLCGGKPTIRSMRMTVSMILEHLSAGDTIEEILEAFPFLEREDVLASLLYAARLTELSPVSSSVLVQHAS